MVRRSHCIQEKYKPLCISPIQVIYGAKWIINIHMLGTYFIMYIPLPISCGLKIFGMFKHLTVLLTVIYGIQNKINIME